MRTSLTTPELEGYLGRQIDALYPDGATYDLGPPVRRALERIEHSFGRNIVRGYNDERGVATFSHLHGDQYAAFLYYASHSAWADSGDAGLASKLFLLNKALNGFVCMYDTVLPDVFILVHTVGIVLGKAHYGNYLVVHQNATVGADARGDVPKLGERTTLYAGSLVVGSSVVGPRSTVSANAVLRNEEIPPDSVVAGASPGLIVKPAGRRMSDLFFGEDPEGRERTVSG